MDPVRTTSLIGKLLTCGIRSSSNLLRRRFNRKSLPEFLWIGVTDLCNSRCIHCNIWRNHEKKQPISADQIGKALSDPLFKKLKVVVLSGGEPTMRKDLTRILGNIHKARPSTAFVLSTNGILPERVLETADYAINRNIPLDIGISLNGIGETHDRTRGVKGMFQKVDALLTRLRPLHHQHSDLLGITIGFTVTDETVSETEQVKRYAERNGFSFNPQWFMNSSYYNNLENRSLSHPEKVMNHARSLPLTPVNDMAIRHLYGKGIRFSCFSLFNFLILKSNGDITPCFSFWDNSIGNVTQTPPSEIWKSAAAADMRRSIRKCRGCLSTCALQWSFEANIFPRILFNFRHPTNIINKLTAH